MRCSSHFWHTLQWDGFLRHIMAEIRQPSFKPGYCRCFLPDRIIQIAVDFGWDIRPQWPERLLAKKAAHAYGQ